MDKTSKLYAERLIGSIAELGVPYCHESSLRFSNGYLGANRLLLTVPPELIRQNAAERLFGVCRRLEMPEPFIERISRALTPRSRLHFGFEETWAAFGFKVDLEQAPPRQWEGEESILLHQSFRWTEARRHASSTRYHWFPSLTHREILQNVDRAYENRAPEASAIFQEVLERAARAHYLEAEDEGHPRRSFDLDLSRSVLRVRDIQDLIIRAAARFRTPAATSRALLEKLGDQELRSLSGGFRADGQEFFTMYYGIS